MRNNKRFDMHHDSCQCASMHVLQLLCLRFHVYCRSMSSSLHDMHSDLSTYVSQMKYYERMQKVKERQQHVQEASPFAEYMPCVVLETGTGYLDTFCST